MSFSVYLFQLHSTLFNLLFACFSFPVFPFFRFLLWNMLCTFHHYFALSQSWGAHRNSLLAKVWHYNLLSCTKHQEQNTFIWLYTFVSWLHSWPSCIIVFLIFPWLQVLHPILLTCLFIWFSFFFFPLFFFFFFFKGVIGVLLVTGKTAERAIWAEENTMKCLGES